MITKPRSETGEKTAERRVLEVGDKLDKTRFSEYMNEVEKITKREIPPRQKELIDKIMFSDMPVKKKRIAVRRLQNKRLEKKFIQLCLKLLEYVEISHTNSTDSYE